MNDFDKLPRIWNTKDSGVIEFVIYPDESEDGIYVGVCLSFDIIVEGTDFGKVKEEVEKVAYLHLGVVREKNLSDVLLNRQAPKEYWDKYFAIKEALEKEKLDNLQRESETSQRIYREEPLNVA